MKTIAMPCVAQLAHDPEELLGLVGIEAGRGLVEDEDRATRCRVPGAIAAICWIATE